MIQRPSIPLTSKHKGLLNRTGENNCFLNVTIQALWHLGAFRYELHKLYKSENLSQLQSSDKLLSTLGNLFYDYEFSDLSILPPTKLREVLCTISDQFELGAFADSNEALTVILEQIHNEHKSKCMISSVSSSSCNSKCISHSVFGMCIMGQVFCNSCDTSSEPTLHYDYMQTVYASQVIKERKNNKNIDFTTILRNCFQVQSTCCPNLNDSQGNLIPGRKCNGQGIVQDFCLEMSPCLVISVVWESDEESPDTINSFLSVISYGINVNEMFSGNKYQSQTNDSTNVYVLRGLVCYYGHHYVSIFQEYAPGEPEFLLFDDQNIRKIGNWDDVKALCVKSHYQPVTLLYEIEPDADIRRSDGTEQTETSLCAAIELSDIKLEPIASKNTIVPNILLEQNRIRSYTTLEQEIRQLTLNINTSLTASTNPNPGGQFIESDSVRRQLELQRRKSTGRLSIRHTPSSSYLPLRFTRTKSKNIL